MSLSRTIAALATAIVLALPCDAWAQTATIPTNGQGLSKKPPVTLTGGSPAITTPSTPSKPSSASAGGSSARLPHTGSDPRLLFFLGVGIVLCGVGLRLRTADADLY